MIRVASRYSDWARDWTVRCLNASRRKRIFSYKLVPALGQPGLYSADIGVLSRGGDVKRSKCNVDHSNQSRAQVKNKWS